MFDTATLQAIAAVAKTYRIGLAELLAVVDIESGGHAFEGDGKTPTFLFEKHIFYQQLRTLAPSHLADAVEEGLAFPSWSPGTEYKNEATSAQRLALLAKAKAINTEAAIRSASWGVGQTMGFLCHELGFVDAQHMLDFMVQGGVAAQVECMVREIQNKKLIAKLNDHNWAAFAYGYNGAGYQANHYDAKLAGAYAGWKGKAAAIAAMPPAPAPAKPNPVKPPTAPVTTKPAPAAPTARTAAVATSLGAAVVAALAAHRVEVVVAILIFGALAAIAVHRFWPKGKS